jgi:hypothetical protein
LKLQQFQNNDTIQGVCVISFTTAQKTLYLMRLKKDTRG